jgi:lipoprotein-anchoring transpeptidase ErfK/SrfK
MKHESISKITKVAAMLAVLAGEALADERKIKGDRIVISVTDRKLVLFQGDRLLKMYDVAVGKASTPTPQGSFQIINRVPNPTWFGPKGVVAPGSDNPLGSRWMGLSASGYGIHGTNAPSSIGKAASHGCIRMGRAEVEELFELVVVGAAVEIHNEWPTFVAKALEPTVIAAN